jgi:heavy metal response regulator
VHIDVRILVIEDEAKIAQFMKRGLKEEGYAVDVAKNGEEGYAFTTVGDYDVVILDIMLPGMDGLELLRKLRKKKPRLPVIMVTARSSVDDRVKGLDLGADDYITKPFAFEELLARLRAQLRKNLQQGTKITYADLELDTKTHKASRAGLEIELSNKEYTLLEYLLANAGNTVTRAMISTHVWNIDFDTSTNVIDVYINYLRKKIDYGHERKLIHTLRGWGYSLK